MIAKKALVASVIAISIVGLIAVPFSAAPASAVPSNDQTPTVFVAHLTGAMAGTDSRAQGQAIFKLSPDGMSMSYRLIVANIQDVTMSHIHVMLQDGSLAAVQWLYPSSPPPKLIPGRTDGILAQGTFTASTFAGPLKGMTMADLVSYIMSGNAFVMVHTTAHPGGEIMGMITASD